MLSPLRLHAALLSRSCLRTRPGAASRAGLTLPPRRSFLRTPFSNVPLNTVLKGPIDDEDVDDNDHANNEGKEKLGARPEHAVISTFDLFSIGGES